MPCPHFRISICSRGKGGSSVASAAYNSGESLFCEYDQHTKNYTYKHEEVVAKSILLPENAPREYLDRQELWNSVENAEPNYNSQIARKIIIALPKELSDEENIKLVKEYCEKEFVSQGMIVDFAIHRPPGNPDNIHAHILMPMRALDENGKWLPKCRKEYLFFENGSPIIGKNGKQKTRKISVTNWDNRDNAEKWRTDWGKIQNNYLENAGRQERVSMDSFEKQGKEEYPTVHLGQAVCAMEARGEETYLGSYNRLIQEINRLIRQISNMIKKISSQLSEVKEQSRQLDLNPDNLRVFDLCQMEFENRMKERETWQYPNGAALKDLQKEAAIFARLNYNNISTISDLDKFLDTKKNDLNELRNQKKSISRQISKIEGIISHAERKKELDEVYKKAHTPGFGKKKYIAEHASELSEWETCNKYLRINLHDEDYNPKALKSEQERLQCKLTDIVNKTNSLKEELDLMSYTRYIIKDYIPELVSDNKTITESQRTEKKESLREKLREKQDNVMHRSSGNSINRNKKEHDLQ